MSRALVTSGLLLCLPTIATAQLIYPLQQERHVTVEVVDEGTQHTAAAGFGTWQDDVFIASSVCPLFEVNGNQYSVFTDTTLDTFGSLDVLIDPDASGYVLGEAQNRCRARFAVAQPLVFELLGYLSVEADLTLPNPDWWGGINASVSVRLNRIAGPELYANGVETYLGFWDMWDPYDIIDETIVATAGVLTPGVYELDVQSTMFADSAADWMWEVLARGELSYVVTMAFSPVGMVDPNQADLDGDGDVDVMDFAHFQLAMTGPLQ